MTEISELNSALWPRVDLPTRLVDPVAFFVALVAGPLAVTAATFWLVVPVFALGLGAPFYVLLGAPLMAWHMRYHRPNPRRFAMLGLLANLGTPVLLMAYAALIDDIYLKDMWLFFFGFGMIFAPAWCSTFAVIYRRLERPFYAQPIPKGAIA